MKEARLALSMACIVMAYGGSETRPVDATMSIHVSMRMSMRMSMPHVDVAHGYRHAHTRC